MHSVHTGLSGRSVSRAVEWITESIAAVTRVRRDTVAEMHGQGTLGYLEGNP